MDIVNFAHKHYWLPETRKPIKLLPHQQLVLKECLTPGKNGLFPYHTILYSTIKKSGKTEIAGLVGAWWALTQGTFGEIYFVANDLEQSQSRGFKRVSDVIRVNPKLSVDFYPKRSSIDCPRSGTEIRALSADYAGEAGANPTLTLWDELWAYSSTASRRLWVELSPSPTRKNSLRFITTYAGFEGESDLLWDLYQIGMQGRRLPGDIPRYVNDEASLYMYWDTGEEARRMPWQKSVEGLKYYEREQRILRPNEFKRIHLNEWVSAVSSYISIEDWDACVNPDLSPIMPKFNKKLFVGVDIGIKRDTTAIVAVYYDEIAKKIRLAKHMIWAPTKGAPVELEPTIERYLLELHEKYSIGVVYYDPSQFIRSSQFLAGQGIPLTEYTQVPTNLTAMTQTLFELIRGRNLEMYPSMDLRKQNMACVILESSRGMRIAKDKASLHIDAIVALAMASQAAMDGSGVTSLPDSQPSYSRWGHADLSSPTLVGAESSEHKSRWRM